MSFGLPSLKVKPAPSEGFANYEAATGIPNLMLNGFTSAKAQLETVHPLYQSEQGGYKKNRDHLNMAMLRNVQGLHAPLRIAMELKAARQVGHLPFLPSSNVMSDSLTGRDLEIGPEDIFNTSEFQELAGQPHAVCERSLGLL